MVEKGAPARLASTVAIEIAPPKLEERQVSGVVVVVGLLRPSRSGADVLMGGGGAEEASDGRARRR